MRYLADTHLLLWSALHSAQLSKEAKDLLSERDHDVFFSTICIWETAIKFALKKKDFTVPAATFRSGLEDAGFQELVITSEHAIVVADLPLYHRDPFDRLLVAQAIVENMTLLTSDRMLARYPKTLLV